MHARGYQQLHLVISAKLANLFLTARPSRKMVVADTYPAEGALVRLGPQARFISRRKRGLQQRHFSASTSGAHPIRVYCWVLLLGVLAARAGAGGPGSASLSSGDATFPVPSARIASSHGDGGRCNVDCSENGCKVLGLVLCASLAAWGAGDDPILCPWNRPILMAGFHVPCRSCVTANFGSDNWTYRCRPPALRSLVPAGHLIAGVRPGHLIGASLESTKRASLATLPCSN
jgi:hypothetical protein